MMFAARLVHYLLEPLFELSAILRTGDHARHVERDDALGLQALGDLPAHDRLRQSLDDSRLADARLADEDRIVLRAAPQNLDDALQLFLAPDYGIQLALPRQIGQIPPECVDCGRFLRLSVRAARHTRGFESLWRRGFRFRRLGVSPRMAGGNVLVERQSSIEEELRRRVVPLAQYRHDEMRRADQSVFAGLHLGHVEDLLRPRRHGQLAALQGVLRAA